jgi:hypothetical protein
MMSGGRNGTNADAGWRSAAPTVFLAGVSVLGVTLCQPKPQAMTPLACAAVSTTAPASVPLDSLAGTYTLT